MSNCDKLVKGDLFFHILFTLKIKTGVLLIFDLFYNIHLQ
jgi:hypothetical protein